METKNAILVFGATGRMGGATARELLRRGCRVRAVTRNPAAAGAVRLAELGAELCRADIEDPASLEAAFDGIEQVFSVQNWTISGVEGEIRQGKQVAEAARAAGVKHLVYGSAGTGARDTGIPHFQAKIEVEDHMRRLDLPFSVVRRGPFMALMTDKAFYPALATWGVEPRLVGWRTPLPWTAVRDIGVVVAEMFQNRERWIGQETAVFSDVKSLAACRDIFVRVTGRRPRRLPLPTWLFRRMAGDEFVAMWRWMAGYITDRGAEELDQIVKQSRALNPNLLTFERWLTLQTNARAGAASLSKPQPAG